MSAYCIFKIIQWCKHYAVYNLVVFSLCGKKIIFLCHIFVQEVDRKNANSAKNPTRKSAASSTTLCISTPHNGPTSVTAVGRPLPPRKVCRNMWKRTQLSGPLCARRANSPTRPGAIWPSTRKAMRWNPPGWRIVLSCPDKLLEQALKKRSYWKPVIFSDADSMWGREMLLSLVVSAVSRSFPDVETVSTSWLGDRLEAASSSATLILDARRQVRQ